MQIYFLIFLLPSAATDSVVRVPSHGASATVIWTGPGRSYLLSCAHAYVNHNKNKPIIIDAPSPFPSPQAQNRGLRLISVDERTDLSLIELFVGPMPYVARVAKPGFNNRRRLISVGYDEMRTPAVIKPTTVLSVDPEITWTRESPWHGRSGGALLDADSGELVGVVSGYTNENPSMGMYVSHRAIMAFLSKQGWSGTNNTNRPWVSEHSSWR